MRCAQDLSIQDDDLCLLHAHQGCAMNFRIQPGSTPKELHKALEVCWENDKGLLGEDKAKFGFRSTLEKLATVSKPPAQEGEAKKPRFILTPS